MNNDAAKHFKHYAGNILSFGTLAINSGFRTMFFVNWTPSQMPTSLKLTPGAAQHTPCDTFNSVAAIYGYHTSAIALSNWPDKIDIYVLVAEPYSS